MARISTRSTMPRTSLSAPLGSCPGRPGGAQGVRVDDGPHLAEVDDALELALCPYRQLHRHGVRVQPLDHRAHGLVEVRAYAIHLVDERYARHAVLVGLAPHRLRLRLYPGNRVEERDRTVEHAQAALHLDGEVHVPGRVYNVDT